VAVWGVAVAVWDVAVAGFAAGAWDGSDGSGNLIVGAAVAGGVVWPCAHADALTTRTAASAAPYMRCFMASLSEEYIRD